MTVFQTLEGHCLAVRISSQEANKEVQKAKAGGTGKRGPYTKYSATLCANIGKYACQHGAAAAARHFTKKLENPVSESTVKSIKKGYKEEMKKKRTDDGEELKVFPAKKRINKLFCCIQCMHQ